MTDCLTVCPGCLVNAEESLPVDTGLRMALPGEACDGCHSEGVDYLDPTQEEPCNDGDDGDDETADLEWEVF